MTKVLNFRTTPGMGDIMHGMNIAHKWSYDFNKPLILRFHWWHDKEHLHHIEDPETLYERFCYISNLYLKANITYEHVFNSQETKYKSHKYKYDWMGQARGRHVNRWSFDPNVFLPTNRQKVVVWRPTFNVERPRLWKRIIGNNVWDDVIFLLKDMGYEVIELCYRTPISEATYHINTCNFIVAYDGMWHYIAKNFYKPMIVISKNNVTLYHTPQCLRVGHKKFLKYIIDLYTPFDVKETGEIISPYDLIHRKAKNHNNNFWEWYDGNR